MKDKKRILWLLAGGLGVGLLNGLLGAGGGILAVPLLEKNGLSAKQAHSSSIAVILPLSLISAAFYLADGRMGLADPLIYIPFGLAGAFFGAWLMKKINDRILRGIFGVFLLWSAWRMFWG